MSGRYFKLDNAAKIYPAIVSEKNSAIFRVAVILKQKVEKDILQDALCNIIGRFPSMAVKLKKGLFWYYFQTNQKPPLIEEESLTPCFALDPKTNDYLFRVLYYNKRIALECFHSLTDGYGAIEFFKALLYEYFRLLGYDVDPEDMVKVISDNPKNYELEDSFQKYYDSKNTVGWKEEKAQHITGTSIYPEVNTTHGILDAKKFNEYAKTKGLTITELIATIFVLGIYEENLKYGICKKPIKVSIPVNLRRIFPSKTLRNFSSYINVAVKMNKPLTFDVVAKEVSRQLREGKKKEVLYKRFNANVKAERNLLMRIVPLSVKNIVLRQVNVMFGSSLLTTVLSNVGIIRVPQSLEKHIEFFEVVLHPHAPNNINCSVCSIGNKLSITFSRCISEKDIIRYFFKYIADNAKINLKVYSNEY